MKGELQLNALLIFPLFFQDEAKAGGASYRYAQEFIPGDRDILI